MIDDRFGKNVKKYREMIGMTQEDLAKKIGYKVKSSLSLIENGKRDVGTSEIVKIANALNVDVTDLLFDQDNEQQLITEYTQDEDLRRLILFAGEHIPKDNRQKYVNAVINTINTLNSIK